MLPGEDAEPDPAQVVVVIETDRGPWVKALAAAGYRVYPANPKQAARHKETIAVSGKKDDFFDAGAPGGHGPDAGGTSSGNWPRTATSPRP